MKLMSKLVALCACAGFALAAININTATQEELMSVKGIGAKKAEAIIKYRSKQPFKSVEDLTKVRGFSEKSVKKIEKELSISGKTTIEKKKNSKMIKHKKMDKMKHKSMKNHKKHSMKKMEKK